jgi:hypothetical protein
LSRQLRNARHDQQAGGRRCEQPHRPAPTMTEQTGTTRPVQGRSGHGEPSRLNPTLLAGVSDRDPELGSEPASARPRCRSARLSLVRDVAAIQEKWRWITGGSPEGNARSARSRAATRERPKAGHRRNPG